MKPNRHFAAGLARRLGPYGLVFLAACGDPESRTSGGTDAPAPVVRLVDRVADARDEGPFDPSDREAVLEWGTVGREVEGFDDLKRVQTRGPRVVAAALGVEAADPGGAAVELRGQGKGRHASMVGPSALWRAFGPLSDATYCVRARVFAEPGADFSLSVLDVGHRPGDNPYDSDEWVTWLHDAEKTAAFQEEDAGGRRFVTYTRLWSGAEARAVIVGVLVRSGTVRVDDLEVRRLSEACAQMLDPRRDLSRWARRIEIRDDEREALVLAPPHVLGFPLEIPDEPCSLRFSLARIDPLGPPVEVEIRLRGGGDSDRTLFAEVLAPEEESAEWKDHAIDLTPYRGAGASLEFEARCEREGARPVAIAIGAPAVELTGKSPSRPDVVLVSLDTVRVDRMSLYGYERETTPHLERIGAESVVFERAIAPASWTLPSHVTLFTGQLPDRHHVTHPVRRIDPAAMPLIAEEFRAVGYRTVAVTAGGFLDPDFGFAAGFEEYRTVDPAMPSVGLGERARAMFERSRERVREILREERSRPLFLFVHTYAAHNYVAGDEDLLAVGARRGDLAEFRKSPKVSELRTEMSIARKEGKPLFPFEPRIAPWRRCGAEAVRVADALAGEVFDRIRSGPGRDRTYLIVLSDHGEELGDHGAIGHNSELYDELVRVPLLIHGPGVTPRREAAMVSLADVAPTIRELVGLPPQSDRVDGRSLVPLLRGEAFMPEPAVLHQEGSDRIIRGLRGEDWKLIVRLHRGEVEGEELFHLARDPREKRNLIESEAEMAERLRAVLLDRVARMESLAVRQTERELSPERIAELRELGYLGG